VNVRDAGKRDDEPSTKKAALRPLPSNPKRSLAQFAASFFSRSRFSESAPVERSPAAA